MCWRGFRRWGMEWTFPGLQKETTVGRVLAMKSWLAVELQLWTSVRIVADAHVAYDVSLCTHTAARHDAKSVASVN